MSAAHRFGLVQSIKPPAKKAKPVPMLVEHLGNGAADARTGSGDQRDRLCSWLRRHAGAYVQRASRRAKQGGLFGRTQHADVGRDRGQHLAEFTGCCGGEAAGANYAERVLGGVLAVRAVVDHAARW